jgi:hypothetical protein
VKILERIKDKIWDLSLGKGISLFTAVFGISDFAVVAFIKSIFHQRITVDVSEVVYFMTGIIFLNLLAFYVTIKLKNRQFIMNGTKVILKTDRLPTMVVSEYSFLKNKVLCVWNDKSEIKKEWLKQEVLKEHLTTSNQIVANKRENSIW